MFIEYLIHITCIKYKKKKNRSKEDIVSAFKFLITLTGAHGFYIIIQSQM